MTSSLVTVLVGRVREERLRLGWTQADAAARIGISGRSYQRFEQSATITLARLQRVLDAFGLTIAVASVDGAAVPTPDARLTRTRQRGLRHARAAAAQQPEPSAAGDVTSSASAGPRKPVRPKPSIQVDPALVATVAKSQRDRIIMTVRAIVSNCLTNYTAYQVAQNAMASAKDLAEESRPAFVAAVVSQLNGLNTENLAGYGIGAPAFERWAKTWNPDLGIVDVLAG